MLGQRLEHSQFLLVFAAMGHTFRKPLDLPEGYSFLTVNKTILTRFMLDCMLACHPSQQCWTVTYDGSNCAMSSLTMEDVGLGGYVESGVTSKEWIHPLIAQSV